MEAKTPQVNELIKLTHSFLLQQDLRPKLYSPTGSDEEEESKLLYEFTRFWILRRVLS